MLEARAGIIPASDWIEAERRATEKCFACDRALASRREARTTDGQRVYVGPDCFARIKRAGPDGYQPPKGGPRLILISTEGSNAIPR